MTYHFKEIQKIISDIGKDMIVNFKGDDVKELRIKIKLLAEIESKITSKIATI